MKRPDPYKNNELSQEGYQSIEDYMKGRDNEYAVNMRGGPSRGKEMQARYNQKDPMNAEFFYKDDPEKKTINIEDIKGARLENEIGSRPTYPDKPELL